MQVARHAHPVPLEAALFVEGHVALGAVERDAAASGGGPGVTHARHDLPAEPAASLGAVDHMTLKLVETLCRALRCDPASSRADLHEAEALLVDSLERRTCVYGAAFYQTRWVVEELKVVREQLRWRWQ